MPNTPLTRAVIVHAYYSSPQTHWYQWLNQKLTDRGVDVTIPQLTAPDDPKRSVWVPEVTDAIKQPADDLLIVAHSLGSITTLLALDSFEDDWQLGALSLVSGTLQAIEGVPPLDEYMTGPAPDTARTASRTRHVTMLTAEDDALVPAERSVAMAKALGATATVVAEGAHFTDADGTMELPALWASIEPLL